MKKQKITFDQLFQSIVREQILSQGIEENAFKIVLDSSDFQEEEMIDGYTIVMVKSYGGERLSIAGVDATPLNIQLIVNTDEAQKWKRIINKLGETINGKWLSIKWVEDETFESVEYKYFSSINTPIQVGGNNQIGTSNRKTITANGVVYYTSSLNTLGEIQVELFDEIEEEYKPIINVLNGAFEYGHQLENFQAEESNAVESETKGIVRSAIVTYVYSNENENHKKLNRLYFNPSLDPLKVRLTFDGESAELYMFPTQYKINYVLGTNVSVNLTLVESSEA